MKDMFFEGIFPLFEGVVKLFGGSIQLFWVLKKFWVRVKFFGAHNKSVPKIFNVPKS